MSRCPSSWRPRPSPENCSTSPSKAPTHWALFGLFLVYVGRFVIADTIAYGSVAPTPWATPMIYPQAGWFAGYVLFAFVAVGLALYATYLLLRGRLDALSEAFDPKGVEDEIKEELDNVHAR